MKFITQIMLLIMFMCLMGTVSIGIKYPDGTTFELEGWVI